MKVRLSDGMIRFRLERNEVDALSSGSPVQENLPDRVVGIRFQLHSTPGTSPSADLQDGIRIGLPAAWMMDWPESDIVGFDFSIPDSDLQVIVEKDFPCSHGDAKPAPPVRMT